MKIQIKSIAGSILFEGDFSCVKNAVLAAIKSSADLRSADLSYADLRSADLSYANLRSADLRYADLRSADLSSANLSYANLSYANLSSANLRSADLRYADLSYANLSYAKSDYFDVLLHAKKEVAGLRTAIIEGRVNGLTYEGECACLVGTLANVAKVKYNSLPNLKPDSERPSERLFLAIKKGDKPENNAVSKIVLEWTDEFIALLEA